MRKFFEGHSFAGVAILLSVFLLAVFLRFTDLASQSPWTDELASWWYLRHLGEIWGKESHSPLYYTLLRFFCGADADVPALRSFSASVSVLHLIEFFFLGQLVFDKKRFLIFWVLVCLCPVDIVYARMARHYAWLLEGLIVFILLYRLRVPVWLESLVAAFMGFIHVFAVIPISFLALYRFWKERRWSELLPVLVSANLVLVYYLLRLLSLGPQVVGSNVEWNSISLVNFWASLVTQFLGDSYPRFVFYPVNPYLAALVVGATSLWILYRRRESGLQYLGVFLVSLLAIEVFGFWLNLRVNRYLIYLVGFWIIAFTDSLGEVKLWQPLTLTGLLLGHILFQNPVLSFPWDREKVESWRNFTARFPDSPQLTCASVYQSAYFDLRSPPDCIRALKDVSLRKDLLYFDLNNTEKMVALFLTQNMNAEEYIPLKSGAIIRFSPKEDHGKSQR